MIQIADGTHLHTTFGRHGFEGRPRFSSIPVPKAPGLPHFFRPDFPLSNDAIFVFEGIEERVMNAQILKQENGYHIVAVTYDAPPHPGGVTSPEILFWVDANSLMVMKQQGDLGHRFPFEDEVSWTRLTTSMRNMQCSRGGVGRRGL